MTPTERVADVLDRYYPGRPEQTPAGIGSALVDVIREAQAEARREALENAVDAAQKELRTFVPPHEWAMWKRWIKWLRQRAEGEP